MMKYIYDLQDMLDDNEIVSLLEAGFNLKPESVIAETFVYYDSFDWRLYRNKLALKQDNTNWTVLSLTDHKALATVQHRKNAAFAWDFPESKCREILAPVLEMRAFLALFEARRCIRSFRILNKNEKTVSRVAYHETWVDRETEGGGAYAIRQLHVIPVRGYDKHAAEINAFLLKKKMPIADIKRDWYDTALSAVHLFPGDYSTKVNIKINPKSRADEAVKKIMLFLLDIMKQNIDGIKNDVDSEFLHDFRVAIRRTRSALAQLKQIFPSEETKRFKKDFAYLGTMTSQLRDIDVYLLEKDRFLEMLPAKMHSDIDPFLNHLSMQRRKTLRNVKHALSSEKFQRILKDWNTFLRTSQGDSEVAKNGAVYIDEFATKQLVRLWKIVIKAGKKIDDSTADEALHDLRIDCKKLRYMIEFFIGLYPGEKTKKALKSLKKLQDNLGVFHDLCVQEDTLAEYVESITNSRKNNHRTILAIGTLIGAMNIKKQKTRAAFAKTFANFSKQQGYKDFTK